MSRNKTKNYYRLSEPQKRIYLSEKLYSGSSINNLCASYYLGKQGNPDLLSEAINRVIRTNDGLRLQIAIIEGVPFQYIEPFKHQFFLPEKPQDTESWKDNFARTPFTFLNNPLYRVAIFYNNNNELGFIINTHHIISDAWTHDTLAKQIISTYNSLVKHETVVFDSPGSYLDYLYCEEEYFESGRYEKSKEYWNEVFTRSKPEALFNKKSKNCESVRYENTITKKLSVKIDSLSRDMNISVPNLFLSLLSITLSNYTNRREFVIGTLIHNRGSKSERRVAGMFVNTLPILSTINPLDSFKEIAGDLTLKMTGLIRNQRFPLIQIPQCPEIEVVYTYENIEFPVKHELHFSGYEQFPLLFRVSRRGDSKEYKIEIDYQKEVFHAFEINHIYKLFLLLIQKVIRNPYTAINNLERNPFNSTEEFYNSINHTSNNYDYNRTLHSIFEDQVVKFKNRTAVSFDGRSLTYSELNRRANVLGDNLLKSGLKKEEPVALILDRSLEMMVALLAVLKSGGCYLPISPDQPIKRTEEIISLADSRFVLFNTSIGESINFKGLKLDLRVFDFGNEDKKNLNSSIAPNNLAYIIFTSGSTGEPKGVMVEHRSVVNKLLWRNNHYPIGEGDCLLQKTPYTFDVSVWELFWWFVGGASIHFLKPGEEKEPEAIVDTIARKSISNIHFVPSMLNLFLEYLERAGSIGKVRGLKRLFCSGEALGLESVQKFKKLLGKSTTIHNLYGPTEAAIEVSYYDCDGSEKKDIPIGSPISNVQLFILDSLGNPLPPGKEGELHIGGVCLARGYFKREDLTNRVFGVNPNIRQRVYATGDIARFREDGKLIYINRKDGQVKIRGNRVELGEIESKLLTFKEITECAVIAPRDKSGNAYLGAYYRSRDSIPHEVLRGYLRKYLPSYMIPSYFYYLSEFPLTPSGKLDKKSLPIPTSRSLKGEAFNAPINDREEEICEIWEDVLKIDSISRTDNFFDLGGDSFSLIKVHFRLQEKYDISLQDLFEFQTVETLSQHIHIKSSPEPRGMEKEYNSVVESVRNKSKLINYYRSISSRDKSKERYIAEVLITGGTGFLGAFLVDELLHSTAYKLYILVRGNSISHSYNRFIENYEYYFGRLDSKFSKRIKVVTGDISSRNLGLRSYTKLASRIDTVIHCGANVNHYGEREKSFSINADGTERVLDFCKSLKDKFLVHISTVSLGLNQINMDGGIFTEQDWGLSENRGNVYLDSKATAESYVNNSGVENIILRVGNIVNDSRKHRFQRNFKDNAFFNQMMNYREKGKIPDIKIPFIDLSYVNEVARAIRLLMENRRNGVYHLFNPLKLTLEEFCRPISPVIEEYNSFLNSLDGNDPLLHYGYYLKDIGILNFTPLCDYTVEILKELGFMWSPPGQYLEKIWNQWNITTSVLVKT